MGDMAELGIGIGWRPEIADAVEALPGVDWVEVVAENICADHLPDSLTRLRERGVTVVPHGVSLGLGGADRPDPARLAALGEKAVALGAPLVTEHIAFVRAGGPLTASPLLEAGHLLPVPRTRDALDVLCENVRIAQDALPVPLALENIAALIAWPGEELTEGQFLAELVERTGVRLLIDVANLHTNHVNRGEDPAKALSELPVEAIAYVHVAGGVERDGVHAVLGGQREPGVGPGPPAQPVLGDLTGDPGPLGVLHLDDRHPFEPPAVDPDLDRPVRRDGLGAVLRGDPDDVARSLRPAGQRELETAALPPVGSAVPGAARRRGQEAGRRQDEAQAGPRPLQYMFHARPNDCPPPGETCVRAMLGARPCGQNREDDGKERRAGAAAGTPPLPRVRAPRAPRAAGGRDGVERSRAGGGTGACPGAGRTGGGEQDTPSGVAGGADAPRRPLPGRARRGDGHELRPVGGRRGGRGAVPLRRGRHGTAAVADRADP